MMTENEAIAVLTACRGLLGRIEASGQGVYYQPTAADRPIIEGVMRVCAAYGGYENKLTFTLSLPGVAERRAEELRWYFGGERRLHDGQHEEHRLL